MTIALPMRLLPFAVADGPRNMATDEMLLESAGEGLASLRFYGWTEATLSLGYFQSANLSRRDDRLTRLPVVRRPTGGGAIVHHHELTYALALPSCRQGGMREGEKERSGTCSWLVLMHKIIARSLDSLGLAGRASSCRLEKGGNGSLCFQHQTPGDILIGAAKVVGSAQRRKREALLQHGSILLATSPHAPALPGIRELCDVTLSPVSTADAIRKEFERHTGFVLMESDWPSTELQRLDDLVATKYSQAIWNLKR